MRSLLCFLGATVLLLGSAGADDKVDADKLLRDTVDSVLTILRDKEVAAETKRDKIMDTVTPVFDFDLMAKLTLGRKHWPAFSKEERKEFTDLFVKQLEGAYLSKFELFSDETVEVDAASQTKGGKVHVNTYVISKGERISIMYKLYKSGGAWKIYDLEIQEVSLISSYRSQYHDALREGKPADLLKTMREKLTPEEAKEK